MAQQRLRIARFDGGLSDDETYGPANSFSDGENMDFRASPALLTTGPALVKESGSILAFETYDMVRVPGGTIFTANSGAMYKRTPGANGAAGTYSAFSTGLGGVRDFDYRADIDSVLTIASTQIGEVVKASTSPSHNPNKYAQYFNLASVQSGGTYTLPSSITEVNDNFSFVATTDPIYSFLIDVVSAGSGQWTLTMHDGANNVIATAQLFPTAGVKNQFIFSVGGTGARIKIGQTYHVHITNNSGSATIITSSANTMATASYCVVVNRLINTGDYGHRTIQLGAKTYICNERYLAEWELLNTNPAASSDAAAGIPGPLGAAGYLPNRLVFPGEIRTNGVALYNEYMAISAAIEEGSDANSTIATKGMIFFWNGTDVFYNFALPVPQGVPNGLFSMNNILYFEANGRWYRWAGADIEMVFEFPGVDMFAPIANGPSTEIYLRAPRNAMAARGNKALIGWPYQTANANAKIGIFSFGQSKGFMPSAIGYDAIISTQTDSAQVATSGTPRLPITGITCVKVFGNNVLVGWKDLVGSTVTYGIDYYNDLSAGPATASWASMWFNNGEPDKEKTPTAIKITFKAPLPTGVTVTPRIRYDNGAYITGDAAGAGAREVVMGLAENRFYECMFGFTVASSNGARPIIRSITFKFDDNREEDSDTEATRA